MRKNVLTTLLLLLAFGWGVVGGAHPCGSGNGDPARPAPPSCHEGMDRAVDTSTSSHAPAKHSGKSSDDCGSSCRHACHMAAVATARPVVFTIEPVAQAVFQVDDPGLALFVPPIDHVPLV